MRKAITLTVACIAAASLVVGCGGGGDDATAAAPSKAQFVKRINQFCKKTEQEKFDRIAVFFRGKSAADPQWEPSKADLEDATLEVVLPIIEKVPQRLAQVTPPQGDEDKVEAIAAALESDIEKTKAEPMRFLESAAFPEGNKAADAYGLDVCTF